MISEIAIQASKNSETLIYVPLESPNQFSFVTIAMNLLNLKYYNMIFILTEGNIFLFKLSTIKCCTQKIIVKFISKLTDYKAW